MKFFDKYMRIIIITGIACFTLSFIFIIFTTLTSEVIYDEGGTIKEIVYNTTFQNLYAMFSFGNIACLTWFAIRSITYKMRYKELRQKQKEEALVNKN